MESWTYDWTLGFQGFLFDVFPDTCQVAVQSFFVALVDDVDEVFQLFTNALHMTFGTRVEKGFPEGGSRLRSARPELFSDGV